MATTRYSDGSTTITLDDGLEKFVRKALDAAAGETVRIMESAAEEVAAKARPEWYSPEKGVRRRTGTSGQIEVVTTVTPDQVTVSVGSTDLKKAKYVHRPGVTSLIASEVTEREYRAAKEKGGIAAGLYFHARRTQPVANIEAGKFYKNVPNPKASDGKYLLSELLVKPGRAKFKSVGLDLASAITKKVKG